MNRFRRHYIHIIFSISGLTLLAGCSTYHNVTAYFNTYYNARKIFSEAVREVEKAPQKDRDTNYFRPYTISKNIAGKFEKVIEKCSKVIQLYPESSFLDHSLVMIGQSYIYRGETESAIRKFREFLENFPNSSLRYEAKLGLAVALYQSGKTDESLLTLQEFIAEATEADENNMVLLGMLLQAQIMVDREDYTEAIVFYEKGMGLSADDDLLARLHYFRAKCYEKLNQPRQAAEAYAQVPEYTKDFAREFQARLRSGVMLAASGEYDAAFQTFSDLDREKLKNEERGLIELERAKTYMVVGDTIKAFELFETIDSTYKRTDASAKAYFERGLMYDGIYHDYPRAKFYYEKAKTEFQASEIAPLAQKKLNTFIQYFKIHENLDKYDSLLIVALTPDSLLDQADSSEIADSLSDDIPESPGDSMDEPVGEVRDSAEIIADQKAAPIPQKADTIPVAAPQKSETISRADSLLSAKDNIAPKEIPVTGDSLAIKPDTVKKVADAGSEPLKQSSPPDSNAIASAQKSVTLAKADSITKAKAQDTQGKIPLPGDPLIVKADTAQKGKDAARQNVKQSPVTDSLAISSAQKSVALSRADSLISANAEGIPKKIPVPADTLAVKADTTKKRKDTQPKILPKPLSPDSLRSLLAKSEYELASLFFLQINHMDSASIWYRHLIQGYQNSEYIPRSLYALSEIERSRGDTVAVDSLYTLILSQYDTTEYARMVKINRGMFVDSTAQDSAKNKYRFAESLLLANDTAGALTAYARIPDEHPASTVAAKSLYTVGWILENYYSLNDSAYYWYKRLLKEYPTSVYAAEVKGKVSVKENPEKITEFIKINEIKAVPMPAKVRRGGKPEITRQEDGDMGDQNPNSRLNRRDAQQDEDEEEVDPDEVDSDEVDPDEVEEEDDDPGYDGEGSK